MTNDPVSEGRPHLILDAIRAAFDIKKVDKLKLEDGGDFFIMGNI